MNDDVQLGVGKRGEGAGDGALHGERVRQVGDERFRRRQLGDHLRGALRRRRADEHVVVAAEVAGDREADTPGSAGDQGNGSLLPRHQSSLFGWTLPAWSMGVICRKSMFTCFGRVAT